MVDWLKPKPKYDPLDDRAAFEQARQRPQPRFDPPERPRDFPLERGYNEESRFPPEMRRTHHDERPQLSERYQGKREEYREQYSPRPQPHEDEYPDEGAPYRKKRSKLPLVLVAVTTSLVALGTIIAAVNIVYVRNPGQIIQSITMLHGEIVIVLMTILINTLLTNRVGERI